MIIILPYICFILLFFNYLFPMYLQDKYLNYLEPQDEGCSVVLQSILHVCLLLVSFNYFKFLGFFILEVFFLFIVLYEYFLIKKIICTKYNGKWNL